MATSGDFRDLTGDLEFSMLDVTAFDGGQPAGRLVGFTRFDAGDHCA